MVGNDGRAEIKKAIVDCFDSHVDRVLAKKGGEKATKEQARNCVFSSCSSCCCLCSFTSGFTSNQDRNCHHKLSAVLWLSSPCLVEVLTAILVVMSAHINGSCSLEREIVIGLTYGCSDHRYGVDCSCRIQTDVLVYIWHPSGVCLHEERNVTNITGCFPAVAQTPFRSRTLPIGMSFHTTVSSWLRLRCCCSVCTLLLVVLLLVLLFSFFFRSLSLCLSVALSLCRSFSFGFVLCLSSDLISSGIVLSRLFVCLSVAHPYVCILVAFVHCGCGFPLPLNWC